MAPAWCDSLWRSRAPAARPLRSFRALSPASAPVGRSQTTAGTPAAAGRRAAARASTPITRAARECGARGRAGPRPPPARRPASRTMPRWRASPARSSLLPRQLADVPQFRLGDLLVFEQVQHQGLAGPIEDTVDEVAHHVLDDLLFRTRRAVEVSAILLSDPQVPLLLERFQAGHH